MAQTAAAAVPEPEVETAAASSEAVEALRQELHNAVVALNEAHVERHTFGIEFRPRLWEGFLLGEQGSNWDVSGTLLHKIRRMSG